MADDPQAVLPVRRNRRDTRRQWRRRTGISFWFVLNIRSVSQKITGCGPTIAARFVRQGLRDRHARERAQDMPHASMRPGSGMTTSNHDTTHHRRAGQGANRSPPERGGGGAPVSPAR
ncbi:MULTISPECIES: hypothetical protein [unclassified Burkholderia]|uniref:hypothetical protein n=1 Tax=unclassified Burkholderia TaxID=2613784 RepID=UPI001422077D|nr:MULTISPECIES: hypothetical protein [unclassified Burkholderia]NIE86724.1 hypothetical protein [Burkholderia sp. Tr-860]NIF66060.1 hypothetical protein [Burkholderia sp. Cy-647]NIF99621.1 hypothetical protein [Burkholderia sp. Ax-1720]